MTTDESTDNSILSLNLPKAAEGNDVVGGHQGVAKFIYDLSPMGLIVHIDPPLAGKLQPGDVIRLILNGASTSAIKTIAAGEENLVSTLYLPKGLLRADRVNLLKYSITRGSNNVGTSLELELLYNAIVPGNLDRTPGDGAHSELKLILPQDVLDDGIDADRAKQGVQVCFSYPYCRAYDRIWLNCNGQNVYHTVTVAEAPAIPSNEPTTVCITVGEDVFLKVGDHPQFVFSYTVFDQLRNGTEPHSSFSGPVLVDVHLKETRLAAPDLAEDPTDPNDDASTINLATLGNKDLSVLVHVFAPLWRSNDQIVVTYIATLENGTVVTHIETMSVSRIPFTYPVMVPNAKVIAGSSLSVKYELVRGGVVMATSNTARALVIGAGVEELLPPFLVGPPVPPLDPLAGPRTLRIEFKGAQTGDRGRLVEVNAPPGSQPFPLVAFNNNNRINVVLTEAFLAARHGQEIRFRWNLNRGGKQVGRSPVVVIRVMKIEDGDLRLPMPKILEISNGNLDLGGFEGDAHVEVAVWPAIQLGQKIWLTAHGHNDNGTPKTVPLLSAYHISHSDLTTGIRTTLLRSELESLKSHTPLTVELKIGFISDGNDKSATQCPILTSTIINVILVSGFENWQEQPVRTITFNSAFKTTSGLTITCHQLHSKSFPSKIYAPPAAHEFANQKTMLFGSSSLVTIDLGGACKKISFSYSRSHRQDGFTVAALAQNGSIIDEKRLSYTNATVLPFEYEAPAGKFIYSIDLRGQDGHEGYLFTNIRWS